MNNQNSVSIKLQNLTIPRLAFHVIASHEKLYLLLPVCGLRRLRASIPRFIIVIIHSALSDSVLFKVSTGMLAIKHLGAFSVHSRKIAIHVAGIPHETSILPIYFFLSVENYQPYT